MFYRIKENKLYDFADYEYADDCLETDIITQDELNQYPNKVIVQDDVLVLNPNFENEEEQKEKERIQELFMTRSDFFDGTIMAWGTDEDMLKPLIVAMVNSLPLDDKLKLKALNNFKNALNFYRKHDLFKMLVNIPIQLTETIQVTITDEHLDKFFDEVSKGNKDTAWQYLPQPELIVIPETTSEEPTEVVENESI